MKVVEINFNKPEKQGIDTAVRYLKAGKVIAYPTDTIYGLGALISKPSAIKKIFKIKSREKKKPLLILVSSIAMLKKYCWLNKAQENYLKKLDRPTSVILKKRDVVPSELTGGADSIAVRLPNLPKSSFLIKMIRRINQPIISTSLNISGEKNLISVENIAEYFEGEKPDLVVDAGPIENSPSQLIDIRNISEIKVIRN